jgi:uncharacterized peroxidase-related enzyme
MPQPDHIIALDIEDRNNLDERREKYIRIMQEKLGFVPNVIKAYSFDNAKLTAFADFFSDLMAGKSGLSSLEREMIAVVVSSINQCYYCLVSHGAEVRVLSGDPELGEMLAMNYRVAELSPRHRSMLDFATKLTKVAHKVEEADRQVLRDVGFSDVDIWDISAVSSFFNMTNRMASAVGMMPNKEYHGLARGAAMR